MDNNYIAQSNLQDIIWPLLSGTPEMYYDGKPIVDFNVYHANQLFRLPGSTKRSDTSMKQQTVSSCVCSESNTHDVIKYQIQSPEVKTKQGKKQKPNPTEQPDSQEAKRIKALLKAHGDNETIITYYPITKVAHWEDTRYENMSGWRRTK